VTPSLLSLILPLAALSILMVVAMVRFSLAIINLPERRYASRVWGLTYIVSWVAIIRLLRAGMAAGTPVPHAATGLVLVAAGWGTFHAFWIWLWLSLERTNARATHEKTPTLSRDALRRGTGHIAVAGLLVVALAVIQLGFMRDLLDTMIEPGHRAIAITATVAAVGFTLLMVGGMRLALARGRPMTHAEIEEQARDIKYGPQGQTGPLSYRGSAYRIFGPAKGAQAEQEVSMHDMKAAWRSGAWRQDSSWRTVFMMTAGGLMMLLGGFGSAVVAGPLVVKVLCGGALLYTAVQLVAAARRA
jgi:hypothetical protein